MYYWNINLHKIFAENIIFNFQLQWPRTLGIDLITSLVRELQYNHLQEDADKECMCNSTATHDLAFEMWSGLMCSRHCN